MSFQKTFDINYYYYHYCCCTFIHCCQENDSHNLENKRLINSLQSFRVFGVFKEYRQAVYIGLKSAKNEEKVYICVKA